MLVLVGNLLLFLNQHAKIASYFLNNRNVLSLTSQPISNTQLASEINLLALDMANYQQLPAIFLSMQRIAGESNSMSWGPG